MKTRIYLYFSLLLLILAVQVSTDRNSRPSNSLQPIAESSPEARQIVSLADAAIQSHARVIPSRSLGAFVPNRGQWDSRVRFGLQDRNVSSFFTDEGFHLSAVRGDKGISLHSDFLGGATVQPVGQGRTRARTHYFVKNTVTNVDAVEKVVYPNVWPGIDVIYEARKSGIEYSMLVHPGADVNAIRLAYRGVERITVDPQGNLKLDTAMGTVTETKPRTFQDGREVESHFLLSADGSYGFEVGAFDPEKPLLIDPSLMYSTYLGGTLDGDEEPYDMTIDTVTGTVVLTGYATSDFITTAGAFDTTQNGDIDGFVTKVDSSGSLIFSTYIGGTTRDEGRRVELDGNGNIIILGFTNSADFPATVGDTTLDGNNDAFLAQLSPDGSTLDWARYLGGSGGEMVNLLAYLDADNGALHVAADGTIHVAGTTRSTDFPVTAGTYSQTFPGTTSIFIAKIAAGGATIDWATYFGGSQRDGVQDITVDAAGNVYLCGATFTQNTSVVNDFPTTAGAYDTTCADFIGFNFGGGHDAIVAKFDNTGGLTWSTYLGGFSLGVWSADDVAYGIAVDPNTSEVIVTGNASYSSAIGLAGEIFPSTAGAFDTVNNQGRKGFLTKFTADGSALVFSTFVGTATNLGYTTGREVEIDSLGNIVVSGYTTATDYPVTADAYQATSGGADDGFITIFNPTGSQHIWSTYLGGSDWDWPYAMAVDNLGGIAIAGSTASTDFPIAAGGGGGAIQPNINGTGTADVFLMYFRDIRVINVRASSPNNVYLVGDTIDIFVEFGGNVIVTGTPELTLSAGNNSPIATYVSGSATNTLLFRYQVGAGDAAPDLDYAGANALALAGGTIQTLNGDNIVLTLPTPGSVLSLAGNSDIVVETTAPVGGTVSMTKNGTVISSTWSGFSDPETGITGYEWAIGSTPNGTDVQGFVAVGTATNAVSGSLFLIDGRTYYVSVRATNGSGLQTTVNSAGTILGSPGSPGRTCSASSGGSLLPAALVLCFMMVLALIRRRKTCA